MPHSWATQSSATRSRVLKACTAYRWLPAAVAASHAATAEVVGPVVTKPLQPGSLTWWPAWRLELTMRREDPGPVNVPPSNVPPSGDVGERLAALAGQRPWWPLVEPTPRWIRVRIGDELVAD